MAVKLVVKNVIGTALLFFALAISSNNAYAQAFCEDRYVTLVNPVRGRQLWTDQSLSPISSQYGALDERGLAATWLLQYDALADEELLNEVKNFIQSHEIGLFMEVSPNMARAAGVAYPSDAQWYSPRAVFLSGYSRGDRKRLVDLAFALHKKEFGAFPKSVGAWWIDSYSLEYMKDKYDISAVMIVADQLATDNYGVWGQWWGIAYRPSRLNILIPEQNSDGLGVVVVQWAQRDLSLAYGESPVFSNHSLQANDYIERGLNTDYFKKLTSVYLDCSLPVGQITVGMETGMEAAAFHDEYERQLDYLVTVPGLSFVTMSQFADKFAAIPAPKEQILSDEVTAWVMRTEGRENSDFDDKVSYRPLYPFGDYFVADTSDFLNRKLTSLSLVGDHAGAGFPYYLVFLLAFGLLFMFKKFYGEYFSALAFLFLAYGPLLLSGEFYGWAVYFGPTVEHVYILQTLATVNVFVTILVIGRASRALRERSRHLLFALLPLSFGLSHLVLSLRYTLLEGVHYLGFVRNATRFSGFSLGADYIPKPATIELSFVEAASLLKLDIAKLYESPLLSLILYPLIHIVLAVGLWLVVKNMPTRMQNLIILILLILAFLQLVVIFNSDPITAKPL